MIELDGVTKVYSDWRRRRVVAVEEFTLRIERGEVLGIAGPNGAGKSTLLSILLGYLRPTAGRVLIEGELPRRWIERNGIGYLSELIAIPPKWTVHQTLVRYATLAGIAEGDIATRVDAAIDRLGIGEHRDKKVKALSKGNLQRLGLAQALLRDERLLILDEPTHGLDPVWTQRFRDLVFELRSSGRAILIASHNLDELERVSDRVAIIDRGRLQRVVARRTGDRSGAMVFRLTIASGHEVLTGIFPGARPMGSGEYEVSTDLESLNAGLGELIAAGGRLSAVVPAYSALEQAFREAVQGGTE